MSLPASLRLILVTPETTLLDEPVETLRFPLFDGQIGIIPGRAPLVGRLGYGELRIKTAKGEQSYFIDGGFVQVKAEIVSVLTNRAQLTSTLDIRLAEDELQVAQQKHATSDVEFASKTVDLTRARRKLALARRSR